MKRIAIILYGRAYDKTVSVIPYTGLDCHAFTLDGNDRHSLTTIVLQWVKQYKNKDAYHFIRNLNPDAIYMNCDVATRGDMEAIYRLGIPIIVRMGGYTYEEERENVRAGFIRGLVSRMGYRLAHRLLMRASHLVVVSKKMANDLALQTGRSLNDISVIPVPCNVGRFNLPKIDDGRVLVVANLNFMGKVMAMRDFLPTLENRGNVKIIAPGRYALDGATSHKIFGFTDHIEREYQKATVFCYFSYLDGCPNVVLEAWASKTPVIVNRCGWSEELIQHGRTGLLVSNVHEAKAAVERLLADAPLRSQLAADGYEYVCANHSPKVAGQKLHEVLSR